MSGIYSLLSAAKTQERNLEVTSNNLANVNTNGFKADKAVFREFLKDAKATSPNSYEGGLKHDEFLSPYLKGATRYAITEEVISDMQPGTYQLTENSYDLAIKGKGFFSVSTPTGTRYTKDGAFQRSADGFLIDAVGNFVLGTNGKINVSGEKLNITSDGLVQVDDNFVDQLRIVGFDDPSRLTKAGKSYYVANKAQPVLPLTKEFSIHQGMLEKSNTSLVKEMLNLITAERSFQAVQRGIKTIDSIDEQSLRLAR
ncbi:MAG: flagellar basal-body rod protein FlgF [SAR324 cluster bacterium]|nr:flagellar basal-body rod protein FlgF [SAR324 cluster bacterium]